ncbi:purple acid phosphatase family protein [Belliella marina]|uniref:Purple acid phosphatase family protein n=1 Tax=Belliella marina TaxID=1644146 RepID=A0ABW4VMQ0_9BACT
MNKQRNYLPMLTVMLLLVLASAQFKGDNGVEAASGVKHLRVVFTEDPSSHAIVSWTSFLMTEDNVLFYDTVPRQGELGKYNFEENEVRNGKITMTAMDKTEGVPQGFYNHAEIKGLSPGKKYYFVVKSGGKVSEEHYFVTGSDIANSHKFLWGGDSRLGGEKPRYAGRTPHVDRQNMNKQMRSLLESNPEIIALFHGADYGSTANWRHLYWWFEDHQLTTTKDNRVLPLVISKGNHDEEIGFIENFWLGEINSENINSYYYTTKLGMDAVVLTLNTETIIGGKQKEWLIEELEKYRSTKRWVIVNYHRPAYPVAKDFNDFTFARVRQTWTPIFDKYRVDLAMESDGHILKRTVPILDGKKHEDGIVYIGEGGLGVPQRKVDASLWFIQPPGMGASINHVHLISMSQGELKLQAIDEQGRIVDEYSRKPRKP